MRSEYLFSDGWLYAPDDLGHDAADDQFQSVTLPHTNIELPWHNFDNGDYQFISTYRKRFRLPEARAGRRVYIDFEGAMIATSVYLNGNKLGDHAGGYTPFSFDLTDSLIENGENVLQVRLDSTEREDIPPFGHVVDYLTFGGVYRDVHLRMVEPVHVQDVFSRTSDVLTDSPKVEVNVMVRNTTNAPRTVQVSVALNERAPDANGQVEVLGSNDVSFTVPAGASDTALVTLHDLPKVDLWTLDDPALYGLAVEIADEKGNPLDDYGAFPIGFREAAFRDDAFYLNGKKLGLIGLNRHQTYPYIGAAAPARLQRKDADIVKYELGCNIVRTSHYPQSKHFIRRCNEIGLLVFEEIPGWQHIGDEDWQAITLRDVEAMIVRDRNEPCIVLWGVRVNESRDNDALYTKTNALAHQLDPTRQTGGVRYFRDSSFLEDVFTYNDFSNDVLEPHHTPYLICEFNGHMFPTKTWDGEERLVEHALRHARIQDKQLGTEGISGGIGWCAFDYNTHREFGSGDRICYHGVMDIFRLPKYAAAFYASQQKPSQKIVLQVASAWTMGDRSEGGNDPLYVFSNCEEIDVYTGDKHFGRFSPARDEFPNLPYPPFKVTGLSQHMFWGTAHTDLRVVGLRNCVEAIEQRIAGDGLPAALTLTADDAELNADGRDMTRLVFKIVDRYGNPLRYSQQVVSFELEGDAELVGENPFALMGGQAALYLRASKTPGTVTVTASTPRLEAVSVTVTLK